MVVEWIVDTTAVSLLAIFVDIIYLMEKEGWLTKKLKDPEFAKLYEEELAKRTQEDLIEANRKKKRERKHAIDRKG